MFFVRDGENSMYKWIDCKLFLCWVCLWCDSAYRYLCVGFLYTWWPKVSSAFLETRTSRKGSFPFSNPEWKLWRLHWSKRIFTVFWRIGTKKEFTKTSDVHGTQWEQKTHLPYKDKKLGMREAQSTNHRQAFVDISNLNNSSTIRSEISNISDSFHPRNKTD